MKTLKSSFLVFSFLLLGLCFSHFANAAGNPATSGLIFEDDFSSGDLTKHNSFFRWGDGSNLLGPNVGQPVVSVTGPNGSTVKAIKFSYGTFQEVRFALTESVTEMRDGSNGSSNVAYPDVWTCYDLYIPSNYFHSTNGPGAVNDKWFAIYKDGYLTSNSGVANFFELVPDGNGNSIATFTDNAEGGLRKDTTSVVAEDAQGTNSQAFAIRTSEAGQWHKYCYHTKVPDTATSNNGVMEVYKDGTMRYAVSGIGFWDPNGVAAKAGFDRGYLLGYHNSIVPADPQVWYLTNFKIGTTAASVGIGASVPEPVQMVDSATIVFNRPLKYTNGTNIAANTPVSYKLYQGLKNQPKTLVATLANNNNYIVNSGLVAGNEYCFQVSPVVNEVEGEKSNEKCKVVNFLQFIPEAVTITVN